MPTTVKVSNFGPIARGSVELRPLTVFFGPSNSGKTFLATLNLWPTHDNERIFCIAEVWPLGTMDGTSGGSDFALW